jgi:hypothetical protein
MSGYKTKEKEPVIVIEPVVSYQSLRADTWTIKILRRINKLILLFLIAFSGITQAQTNNDHLEPVKGIFDIYDFQFEYYSQIRKVLFNGLSDKPEIRFLTIPSFTPENVLQIDYDKDKNTYYCVFHICDTIIWYSKNRENVTVKKYRKAIEKQSVELIKSLYDLAISQTKFYEIEKDVNGNELITMGTDGENYYLSVNRYGQKSGTVWTPCKNTRMAELIAISCELIEKTKEQNDNAIIVFDNDFRERIKKLIALLQKS